jgi:hypothetical protein
MGSRNIHIDNVQVRIPRSLAGSARQIGSGLGKEILRRIAETTRGRGGTRRVGDVSAGKIRIESGADIQAAREDIAGRVAAEVAKKITDTEDGG